MSSSLEPRLRRDGSSIREVSLLFLLISSLASSVVVRPDIRGLDTARSSPPFRLTALAATPRLDEDSTACLDVDELSCSLLGDSLGFLDY